MIKSVRIFFPLFISICLIFSAYAAERPGRIAIATAHPLATQAGLEVMEKGGNAFDAAVAISAALGVVEPYSSGFGGGGFWLLHRAADNKQIMIDGRETAPGRATRKMYQDRNGDLVPGMSLNGPMAAGIPGMPAAIVHINEKYGKLSLKENLDPAIRYATDGFFVTELYQKLAGFRREVLKASPDAAKLFLHENEIPPVGHSIIQKDLAEVIQRIANEGHAGFYAGETARQLVDGVNQGGGIWSLEDLAKYRVVERDPIVTNYRDIRVISAPPPSSGGIVLAQILNMLEHFDLNSLDNITRKHVIIEAMRRAYRDRAAYLGDPDFVEIDKSKLLDEEYLDGLAATIEVDRATSSMEIGGLATINPVGEDTTHFSVIDSDGNRVSATLSINLPFGSGFVPPGTGVLLNDEMDDFATKPLEPNAYGLVGDDANSIAPGKRPLSSMTPAFLETDDSIAILGTPGGSRIITMVLLGILDFAAGQTPKSWVSIPRFHHQYLPDEVQFEKNGLTVSEQSGLKQLGHQLAEKDRVYGNMQAILWYKTRNLLFAASDPRGEGEAIVRSVSPAQ